MKKVVKSLFFCIFIGLYSACTQPRPTSDGSAEDVIENIKYAKDKRTNLCFGMLSSASADGFRNVSVTCVPCDSLKNVEVLIVGE
ncbi:MAG: hypothetical protein WDK96_03480 [Candidatus Paceibacterota bacterium]|jgi:hypothetical protein